jgi:hypothetical protein
VSARLSRWRYDRAVSPQRRDAEGRRQIAPTWESLVERQIREAMEGGAFEDLPYQGERLPLEDDSAAGEWAMAHRMLRNAGIAPPWIESDKEARKQLAALEALIERAPSISPSSHGRARSDLAHIVAAANQAIARVNSEAPTLRQHRRPLDPAVEAERLERAFST